MIVCLDKTGSDSRNSVRAYRYGLRRLTPVTQAKSVGKENICGIENAYIYEGWGCVQTLCTALLPLLMPYNGVNTHSVVVDIATIHHLQHVQDLILGVIRFFPAYSLIKIL